MINVNKPEALPSDAILRLTRAEFDALPDYTAGEPAFDVRLVRQGVEQLRWKSRGSDGKWYVCGERQKHHIAVLDRTVTLFKLWIPMLSDEGDVRPV